MYDVGPYKNHLFGYMYMYYLCFCAKRNRIIVYAIVRLILNAVQTGVFTLGTCRSLIVYRSTTTPK